MKIEKVTEQELACKFIRIDHDKEEFLELSIKYLDALNNQL